MLENRFLAYREWRVVYPIKQDKTVILRNTEVQIIAENKDFQ